MSQAPRRTEPTRPAEAVAPARPWFFAPALRAPQPDFLRPVARPGALAWAWCATGLLALGTAAVDGHTAWQDRSRAQAQLAAAQADSRRQAPPPLPPRPEQRAREAEAQRWLQQLALPWPAVWAGAELAADGVAWTGLAHSAANGLRLTGTAATLAPAQATAQALRGQHLHDGRPVWQAVALASVERTPDGLRFELAARLAGLTVDAP